MTELLGETRNLRLIRILSVVALAVGIGGRVFDFCNVPSGLNQDEASIGYEAWSLLHYGIDRNGFSWPIHLPSWGSGQNALYAYLSLPFVAFGLSPCTVRLPMLLSACASLALVWLVARRLFGELAAWCVLTAVALSPWHIMMSRWALESNLLPFVFLSGLACLLKARDSSYQTAWLIGAGAVFGLSLYAYGTAYLAVPIFILGALVLMLADGDVIWRRGLFALGAFAFVALPIGLYVAINFLKWQTVAIAGMSVPRLPVVPRIQTMVTSTPLSDNAEKLWRLFVTQSDGTIYNVTEPYGILYSGIFIALGLGLAVVTIIFALQRRWPARRALLALWLVAALPTGLIQQPNINRINLLLMGVVFAAGVAPAIIDKYFRGAAALGLVVLLIWSGAFLRAYFTEQRHLLTTQYPAGFLSALQHARAVSSSAGHICVTGEANMPYIFALFGEHTDPHEYLHTVKYIDANAPMRQVSAFGRYTFGLERCDFDSASSVVTRIYETVPGNLMEDGVFDSFKVYVHKRS